MKNQHTPGPWRVVCASAHEFNPDTLRKDIIGKCQFGDAYVAGDISANDAALISAAPDLLSAVRFLLADYVAINGEKLTGSSVPVDMAQAAIAKAEGAK